MSSRYRAFVRAAELQSLTRAADELHYTQSNISQAIQSLEKEYGFQLLIRNKGGVFLTENGKTIIDIMRSILNLEDKLSQTVNRINGVLEGTLRIGSFSSVSCQWLPDLILYFEEHYPGIEIRLLNGEYHEIMAWLQEGKVDCGFITDSVAHENIRFIPLIRDEMLAVVSESFSISPAGREQNSGQPEGGESCRYDIRRFGTDPFIYPYKSHSDDVRFIFEQNQIQPNVRFEVKGDEAIMAMVRKNLGVGLLPRLYLDMECSQVRLLPLAPRQYRIIGTAVSNRFHMLPLTRLFLDCLKVWLSEHYTETLF